MAATRIGCIASWVRWVDRKRRFPTDRCSGCRTLLAHVLHFDVRIFSLVGQLVVPAAAVIAAATDAHAGRWLRAAILAALSVALLWDSQYREFFPIGHTQIYWPLLLVFAILVVQERWTAACVVAGLLCAARTTMVSIVPVLLIALYVKRELGWRRVALVAIAAIGPLVPFFVTRPRWSSTAFTARTWSPSKTSCGRTHRGP